MTQIFESPDGGKTVYVREMGGKDRKIHSVSPAAKEEMKEILLVQEWLQIRHAAKDNPALKKAVENALLIYRLTKKNVDIHE